MLVIGLYVPSRDASLDKTERKRKWQAACDAALDSVTGQHVLLLGDLSILEPGSDNTRTGAATDPGQLAFGSQVTKSAVPASPVAGPKDPLQGWPRCRPREGTGCAKSRSSTAWMT